MGRKRKMAAQIIDGQYAELLERADQVANALGANRAGRLALGISVSVSSLRCYAGKVAAYIAECEKVSNMLSSGTESQMVEAAEYWEKILLLRVLKTLRFRWMIEDAWDAGPALP
jgi:hypothetical protein